jgi:surfeit locus 1 family protein
MPGSWRGIRLDLEWRTTLAIVLLLPLLTGLGFWQLQRADEKASIAAVWEQMQSQPPVPIGQLWHEPAANLAYQQVTLSGEFSGNEYFLLDNRIYAGRFGVEVLGIVELDGGAGLVLVNRGWLAADPARRTLPTVPPVRGRVELTGHVYVAPDAPYMLQDQQMGSAWPIMLQAVEMAKIRPMLEAIKGGRVFPYPVRLAGGEPGALAVDWQLVNTSPDKHRAYAAQWFTMAAVLLVFFVLRSSNLWQLVRPAGRNRK